jgi:hypothetical protein
MESTSTLYNRGTPIRTVVRAFLAAAVSSGPEMPWGSTMLAPQASTNSIPTVAG